MIPDNIRKDHLYSWDIGRYNRIALEIEPGDRGVHPTNPPLRAKLTAGLIKEQANISEVAILGTGFGFLEDHLQEFPIVSVDQSIEFLKIVHSKYPNKIAIEGVFAHLPFLDNSVRCLVCESTFHTLNNKSRFLHEVCRVTCHDALIIITIGYRWNYARKPQEGFNITVPRELDTLRMFLEDLGIQGDFLYFDTRSKRWVDDKDSGDYLYMILKRGSN